MADLPRLRHVFKSKEYYIGVDPPGTVAVTCEWCQREIGGLTIGTCPAGNGFNHHAHLVCAFCWPETFRNTLLSDQRMGALSWLN